MKRSKGQEHLNATDRAPTFKTIQTLKSHLDTVTSIHFNSNLNVMATSSEDRTVKLWRIDQFSVIDKSDTIFPYLTFRGHQDPIFCMTGPPDTSNS